MCLDRSAPGRTACFYFRSLAILAAVVLVGIAPAGCASSDTALLPESERSVTVDRPYGEAFELVGDVLRAQGYEIDVSARESGTIRTAYRPDDRIENMSASAWSRVEASLVEGANGTRIVLTARARYSSATPNYGVGSGEMPRDDQRTVLEPVTEAIRDR